jgi:hypothetical protein
MGNILKATSDRIDNPYVLAHRTAEDAQQEGLIVKESLASMTRAERNQLQNMGLRSGSVALAAEVPMQREPIEHEMLPTEQIEPPAIATLGEQRGE